MYQRLSLNTCLQKTSQGELKTGLHDTLVILKQALQNIARLYPNNMFPVDIYIKRSNKLAWVTRLARVYAKIQKRGRDAPMQYGLINKG